MKCERCGKEFDPLAYKIIVGSPNSLYNKHITICPNCIMELVHKYTNLNWDFETFVNSFIKRAKNDVKSKFSLGEYHQSNFYKTLKNVMEKTDGKKYDNILEIYEIYLLNSEYFFLNFSASEISPFPKHWLAYRCIDWKKDNGGPDFIFEGNKGKTYGLELVEISHNHFLVPEKIKAGKSNSAYTMKCISNIAIKEGYFENYLKQCVKIVSNKNEKSCSYDKTDYLYLGIISTQSMVTWHYFFLEMILNNLKEKNSFDKILIL